MADRAPGTATPPPTLGEGCVRRYDPEALSEHDVRSRLAEIDVPTLALCGGDDVVCRPS